MASHPPSPHPPPSAQRPHADVLSEIPRGYTIHEEIGRGSFATVYAGFKATTQQKVAIKVVVKSKLTNKLSQNLQDEINILKKIRHHNVVGLLDCITTHQFIFLVMQFCQQGDLSVYIKTRSKLPSSPGPCPDRFPHPSDGGLNEWVVRSFLGQLADALHFMRSYSIIHRDIKPQNLLLHPSHPCAVPDPSSPLHPSSPSAPAQPAPSNPLSTLPGRPRYVPEGIPILKVADFGFARVLAPNAGLAETLCGSPLYMAPEILRYEKYDAKADLWSVGAVLYEMCVGKPPFRAQNHVELLKKIERSEDRIAFPEDKPVAEDIKILIRALLRRNPSQRINFDEFFDLVDRVSRVGVLLDGQGKSNSSNANSKSKELPSQTGTRPADSKNIIPRPPSTSTFPHPSLPKPKPGQSTLPPNLLEGEPGAFAVNRKPPSDLPQSNPPNTLEPTRSPAGPPRPSAQQHSPGHIPASLPVFRHRPPTVPSFPSKYVIVGGARRPSSPSPNWIHTTAVAENVKTKDYALVPSSSVNTKPGGGTHQSNTGPGTSRSSEFEEGDLGAGYVVVEKGSVEINALVDALSSSPSQGLSLTRRMSRGFMSSRPTLPGLSLSPHPVVNPSSSSSPPPSSLITTVVHHHNAPYSNPNSSLPPRSHQLPSPNSTGAHPMMITKIGRSSPSTVPSHHYSSSPRSFDSNGGGGGGGGFGSLPIVGKYFPQSGQSISSPSSTLEGLATSARPPSSLSSAAAQAMKSEQREFRFPSHRLSSAILARSSVTSSCSCGVSRMTAGAQNGLDQVEVGLINDLERLTCKILVILEFADEKLAKILPPLPSSSNTSSLPPLLSSSSGAMTGTHHPWPSSGGQQERGLSNFVISAGTFISPLLSTARTGEPSTKATNRDFYHPHHRTQAQRSNLPPHRSRPPPEELHQEEQQQPEQVLLACEAMVLYLRVLKSLDLAIRHGVGVLNWKQHRPSSSTTAQQGGHAGGDGLASGGGGGGRSSFSPEVALAIEWLRNKFNEVFDKAEFVKWKSKEAGVEVEAVAAAKSRKDGGVGVSAGVFAERLIYEHAVEKSKDAALKELRGFKSGGRSGSVEGEAEGEGELSLEVELVYQYECSLEMLLMILGDLIEQVGEARGKADVGRGGKCGLSSAGPTSGPSSSCSAFERRSRSSSKSRGKVKVKRERRGEAGRKDSKESDAEDGQDGAVDGDDDEVAKIEEQRVVVEEMVARIEARLVSLRRRINGVGSHASAAGRPGGGAATGGGGSHQV